MIKGVFFDFWETLVVFNGESALNEMRLKRVDGFRDTLLHYNYNFSKEAVWKALESVRLYCGELREKTNKEFSSKEVIKMVLQKLSVKLTAELCNKILEIYSNSILSMDLTLRAKVDKILAILKQKGLKIGLISNTEHGAIERYLLKRFNIGQYFDSLTFSCDVGVRKPRVEIFNEALKSLNLTPTESVHIGDWPEIDILGAKRAGLGTIYLKVKDRPYSEELPLPDAVIEDIAQVPIVLDKVFI
ncbi:MAG: HAD family hydrolase [bacterium]|nr:HAD family hydrolase [bacterium]